MKKKIIVDLPSAEELVKGLTLREVHPALTVAEQNMSKAETALTRARADLETLESTLKGLIEQSAHNDNRTQLASAMQQRDAAAQMIAPREKAIESARLVVETELLAARAALTREAARRSEQHLSPVAAELSPALEAINDLWFELQNAIKPTQMTTIPSWPDAFGYARPG